MVAIKESISDVCYADAIVNICLSGEGILGGWGSDPDLLREAGRDYLEECRKIGYLPKGEVVITKGYNLYVPYVMHSVIPSWRYGLPQEIREIALCYEKILSSAEEKGFEAIAFTTNYIRKFGFPVDEIARLSVHTAYSYLQNHPGSFKAIYWICNKDEILNAYKFEIEEIYGSTEEMIALLEQIKKNHKVNSIKRSPK